MGNRLRGSLPNEMLNMNRNLRLNFTNNLYDPVLQDVRVCESALTSSHTVSPVCLG
jgi:hypothetical protein